ANALEKRQQELQKLQEVQKAKDAKADELSRLVADLQAKLANAEVERELLKKRSTDLEKALAEAEKRAARAPEEKKDKNPPKDAVEGELKEIDEKSGLMTVSIGSDVGLEKGHTLEVFRTAPVPKYLGSVRVVEVGPKTAVVKFVGKPLVPPEKGDKVA